MGPQQPPKALGASYMGPQQPPKALGASWAAPQQPPKALGASWAGPQQPPKALDASWAGPQQPPRALDASWAASQQPRRPSPLGGSWGAEEIFAITTGSNFRNSIFEFEIRFSKSIAQFSQQGLTICARNQGSKLPKIENRIEIRKSKSENRNVEFSW